MHYRLLLQKYTPFQRHSTMKKRPNFYGKPENWRYQREQKLLQIVFGAKVVKLKEYNIANCFWKGPVDH